MQKLNTIKIAAMSDIHGNLVDVEETVNVVVIAGDIVPLQLQSDNDLSRLWLENDFSEWAENLPCEKVVMCAGNHDFIFENLINAEDKIRMSAKIVYLKDTSFTHKGFKFYGSPWTPWFFDWAFNLDYSHKSPNRVDPNEKELDKKFSLIPEDTDILLTHGPPRGYKDVTPNGDNVGSRALLKHVKRVMPLYHFFGHIHLDDKQDRQWECLKDTVFVNVSILNNSYKAVRGPVVVEAFKQ